MSNELIISMLAIGFIGSLAAMFILWAKLDEQKKMTREERDRRWDEISLRRTVEKEKDAQIESLKENCNVLAEAADFQFRRGCHLHEKNIQMQDKLSALLCPRNDHVWKDGFCIRCGRSEEKLW